jgi:hypothetical protein
MQILCKSLKEKTSQNKKKPCKFFEKERERARKRPTKCHANPWKRKSLRENPKRSSSYSGQEEEEDLVSLTGLL